MADDQKKVDQYETATLKIVRLPYGTFRNTLWTNHWTGQFRARLRPIAENVYVHVADPDTVSLRPRGRPLFSVYDDIITQYRDTIATIRGRLRMPGRPRPRLPFIIAGGYRFEDVIPGAPTLTLATRLGNELDTAIRQALTPVSPMVVYPTEPNMLVRVTRSGPIAMLNLDWGQRSQEGQAFLVALARALKAPLRPDDVVYESAAAITTYAIERLRVHVGFQAFSWEALFELNAEQVQRIFEQGQSLAGRAAWSRGLLQRFFANWFAKPLADLNDPNLTKHLTEAFGAFYDKLTPNGLVGYEPKELSKAIKDLSGMPGYNDLATARSNLQTRLKTVGSQFPPRENIKYEEMIEQVAVSARATGEAIVKFFKPILG